MSTSEELLFPTATPADIDRKNVQLQIAQSYRIIDGLDHIMVQEGKVDPQHADAVISAFKQQLEEMTTIVAIQNNITEAEFGEGVHMLEHFYEEQLQKLAKQMVEQAQLPDAE